MNCDKHPCEYRTKIVINRELWKRMYVCMYVCIYVCMHVMYVCMLCMHACMHMYVCMYVCMQCVYVCMYICMYSAECSRIFHFKLPCRYTYYMYYNKCFPFRRMNRGFSVNFVQNDFGSFYRVSLEGCYGNHCYCVLCSVRAKAF
jgi:hypothetical protein